MTFEVSFDDATWTTVPIDREGDIATASVQLSQDAEMHRPAHRSGAGRSACMT